jgi:hypothetical protein
MSLTAIYARLDRHNRRLAEMHFSDGAQEGRGGFQGLNQALEDIGGWFLTFLGVNFPTPVPFQEKKAAYCADKSLIYHVY